MVVRPTCGLPVDAGNEVGDGDASHAVVDDLSDVLLFGGHCFGRWVDREVSSISAILVWRVPGALAEEVDAVRSGRFDLPDCSFITIDFQSKSIFHCIFYPRCDAVTDVSRLYNEVIGVPDQSSVGPVFWAVVSVEEFVKPVQVEVRQ